MNPIAFACFVLPLFRGVFSVPGQAAPAPQAQAEGLVAERRELAEIRIQVAAERGHAQAKERLVALAAKLATRTDPEAKSLLDEVSRLESEVRRALGESAAAAAGKYQRDKGQDRLDEAVYSALRTGDLAFVQSLGRRAVPSLRTWVRSAPDQFKASMEEDPLLVLLRIDALAASELAGETPAEAGFYWKKRVSRLYETALAEDGLWLREQRRWLGTGFLRSAEAWAEDPDVGGTALFFLHQLAQRGERSPAFDGLVARALRSPDPARRQLAMRFDARTVGAAAYVALLGEGEAEAELRIHAAQRLARSFPEDPALLVRRDDPEMQVRHAVAERLTRHQAHTEEERAALARLLADAEAPVRELARRALEGLAHEQRTAFLGPEQTFLETPREQRAQVCRTPLAPEVYRALVAQGKAAGLGRHFAFLEAPLCFELLGLLARSGEPGAAGDAVEALGETRTWEDPRASLAVADALLANPLLDEDQRFRVYGHLKDMTFLREGLAVLVRWFLEQPDDESLQGFLRRAQPSASDLARIDGALGVAFAGRIYPWAGHVSREFFTRARRERTWTAAHEAAARALAADPRAALGARVLALHGLAFEGTAPPDFAALARPVLTDPGWAAATDAARNDLLAILQGIGAPANALIAILLEEGHLPQELAVEAAARLAAEGEGAGEVVRLVLAHGLDEAVWTNAVRMALRAMGQAPALQDPEVLARAARHPWHARTALSAIGRLRDVRYLPLLTEIVSEPIDGTQLAAAVGALCEFLDAEAVEPLLTAAAKVQTAELRDQCLAQLERIREYQDAKERWATRKVRAQTREQVIAQLVEQLGAKSDEVKVQAIRALATWEAVEVMPRLIELSASGSKAVAAAAREALERLNRPKGE